MEVGWDYSIDNAVRKAAMKVITNDKFLGKEQVEKLEKEYCGYFGRKYAIAVSSATSGLHCAVLASKIGPGDEVIAPPNTDWAILHCILYVGGTPVFSEVEEDTMNIDPSILENAITPKTKAIMIVSTAGHPADFDPILEIASKHNLKVIHDAAQSLGAKYKGKFSDNYGDITVTSFNNHKHVSSGHVGIVSTENEDLAKRIYMFADAGEALGSHPDPIENYINPSHQHVQSYGFRYRPSEIHCAMARVQLRKFTHGKLNPERRRKIATYYTKQLSERLPNIRTPVEKTWAYHTYLRYIVRIKENRNELFKHLRRKKITAFIHYAAPLHTYEIFTKRFGAQNGKFPVTERMAREVLTLPNGGTLTRRQLDYVINSVEECYN